MTSGHTIRRWLGERWVPLAFGAFCLIQARYRKV